MKISSSLALLSLGNVVLAAFGTSLVPYCWRKCANQAGLSCFWGDVPCLCRSITPALMASANACACESCDSDGTRIQFSELAFACKMIRVGFRDPSDGAQTCGAVDPPPSNEPPPPPFIAPVDVSTPTPTAYTSRLPSSSSLTSIPPPPSVSHAPVPITSSPVPISSSPVISIPIFGASASASDTSSSDSIVYATLTVPVVPIPQSSSGPGSSSKSTGTSSASATASKSNASAAPTSSTGSALRREVGTVWWAVSMLTAGAIVVYGVA